MYHIKWYKDQPCALQYRDIINTYITVEQYPKFRIRVQIKGLKHNNLRHFSQVLK